MSVISLTCPHAGCNLEKAAFVTQFVNVPAESVYECFAKCPGCHRSVIALFHGRPNMNLMGMNGDLMNIEGHIIFYTMFPNIGEVDTPLHTPETVARLYEQGFDSLRRGNWDAAGMMFRKCLESALRNLHPLGSGSLFNRINNLPPESGVTDAMKEWAHEIRGIGNESAHEGLESEEDAVAISNFTNTFLQYAYTMPNILEHRRQLRTADET